MAKNKRKIAKKNIFIIIMAILSIVASVYSIYSLTLLHGIETKVRMILCAIIAIFGCFFTVRYLYFIKHKSKKYLFYIPITLIYSIGLLVFGYYISKTYKAVDKFSSNTTTYSASLVSLSSNKVDKIEDVKGNVGILKDEKNIIGYQMPKEIIKENNLKVKLKEYDSFVDVISGLYDEEIKYAFLPTNYNIMFSNYEGKDFSKIAKDTKIIYTKEKAVKEKQTTSSKLDKPFTILLMGVDSEQEDLANASFNGDSLMLVTFNPETLNATILSIPRDTYVPIMCFAGNAKSKITHAAWNGESCMISTIENFTGIDIDYYVKINFKGVVRLVDTLGGIEVDVPYSFCESDSNRAFGRDTIYVEKGLQTLNGEQALAFSRNRHTWEEFCGPKYSNYVSNDFVRGQNQQTVVKAILNKMKAKGDLDTLYKLLEVLGNNMETNMSTNEILSLYNIVKDVVTKSSGANMDDVIGMQKLYLSGHGTMNIYDTTMRMYLYNYVLYQESLDAVVEAMKINLGKEDPKMIKEFAFNINEEYEQDVIGKMDSGTDVSWAKNTPKKEEKKESTSTKNKDDDKKDDDKVEVPDFVGMTYTQAKNKANSLGLYLNPSSYEGTGKVKTQDTPAGKKIDKGLTIGLTFEETAKKEEKEEDTKVKNKCVEESGIWYWYDGNGDKNPTKYSENTCTTKVTDNSSNENNNENNNENSGGNNENNGGNNE